MFQQELFAYILDTPLKKVTPLKAYLNIQIMEAFMSPV